VDPWPRPVVHQIWRKFWHLEISGGISGLRCSGIALFSLLSFCCRTGHPVCFGEKPTQGGLSTHKDREKEEQTQDRHTDRQDNRQTDTQTDRHRHTTQKAQREGERRETAPFIRRQFHNSVPASSMAALSAGGEKPHKPHKTNKAEYLHPGARLVHDAILNAPFLLKASSAHGSSMPVLVSKASCAERALCSPHSCTDLNDSGVVSSCASARISSPAQLPTRPDD